MGGFEGGDEGGYWEVDTTPAITDKRQRNKEKILIQQDALGYRIKAHAKVTLFFRITGYQDEKPTVLSRYIRVNDLYDTISFTPCACESFSIEGCGQIPLESNTIYQAYKALMDYTNNPEIEEFFSTHKVVVTKNIPVSAGLAGASSDAAAFMHLLKEACNLILSTEELSNIARSIAEDAPFFIHNYPSANVSGFGEIIEPFEEEALSFEFHIPKRVSDMPLLQKIGKEKFSADTSVSSLQHWQRLDSKSILQDTTDPTLLNDLYAAAHIACPELEDVDTGWFFSGKGPAFFKLLV